MSDNIVKLVVIDGGLSGTSYDLRELRELRNSYRTRRIEASDAVKNSRLVRGISEETHKLTNVEFWSTLAFICKGSQK